MKLGFLNLLTLIFVIAKLAGAISWSWWIIFIPTYIGVGLVAFVLFCALLAAAFED
jgi:hypothetical protein